MKRALVAVAALALVLGPRSANANPSLWQRARDPAAAAQEAAFNRVERTLGAVDLPELDPELSAAAIAMSVLSQTLPECPVRAGSRTLRTKAQARFDYVIGGALLESHTNREADARCILERALREAPDSPLAAEGWFHLGIAAALLGDRAAERAAYVRALAVTWAPDVRAALLSNLAESEMGSGDLKAALRDYRAALEAGQEPEARSSAYFGLAVALDRSGDLPSALDAAHSATSIQLPPTLFPASNVLDLPGTFFTPSYEVDYYKALAAMADARAAKDDLARRDALAEAAEHWSAYLVPADSDGAPWAPRARLHQARIARELSALQAKLPKIAAPQADPEPSVL
jgi:tetratricopeptide (TPR) repeat protein